MQACDSAHFSSFQQDQPFPPQTLRSCCTPPSEQQKTAKTPGVCLWPPYHRGSLQPFHTQPQPHCVLGLLSYPPPNFVHCPPSHMIGRTSWYPSFLSFSSWKHMDKLITSEESSHLVNSNSLLIPPSNGSFFCVQHRWYNFFSQLLTTKEKKTSIKKIFHSFIYIFDCVVS